MSKPTRQELNDALELACRKLWKYPLPNGKCETCVKVLECKNCWKDYLIARAKEKRSFTKEKLNER